MRCPWCCNPESQNSQNELLVIRKQCVQCGRCIRVCPTQSIQLKDSSILINRASCLRCKSCVNVCLTGAIIFYGQNLTVEELMKEVLKDEAYFIRSSGGLTFSGGEATLQSSFVRACVDKCRRQGLGTAVETAGAVEYGQLYNAVEFADEILFDIKTLNARQFQLLTGIPLITILQNLSKLCAAGKRLRIRCPIIPGFNDTETHIDGVIRLALDHGIKRVDFLPFHQLGSYKYQGLDKEYLFQERKALKSGDIEVFKARVEAVGLKSVIGG